MNPSRSRIATRLYLALLVIAGCQTQTGTPYVTEGTFAEICESLPGEENAKLRLSDVSDDWFQVYEVSEGAPAMSTLENYDWPGNIRELENEIKRLIAVGGDIIHDEDLSDQVQKGPRTPGTVAGPADSVRNLDALVRQVEVDEIRKGLSITEGNKTRAAEMLGISRFTLQRKMEKYNLS